MMSKIALIVICLLGEFAFAQTLVAPSDSRIQYFGRWERSNSAVAEADWPGVSLRFAFRGTGCSVRMAGENDFEIIVDGQSQGRIEVRDSAQSFVVAKGLDSNQHVLILQKRSESQVHTSRFLGIELPKGVVIVDPPARPQRRIEFIGDSYTVGYGMESPVREPEGRNEDSLLLHSTNTFQAFGPLVARSLAAEVQVNAFSGRGLVRNINGIVPDRPFGYFYDYTLLSARNTNRPANRWDFATWHPQVIVIGLGINDFQGNSIPADTAVFVRAYGNLLDTLRVRHPGVKFVLCATQVWPTELLIPMVRRVAEREAAKGKTDVLVFEYGAEKTGLWWHPDIRDHQNIARELRPLVAKQGGWLSR